MVKQWQVKSRRHKATYLRREPIEDHSERNVLALIQNGESVCGEFMFVRRASRETGFIQIQHLEHTSGNTWRIKNGDNCPTTLLRKHPQESDDSNNAAGSAMEGEHVDGEFIFVVKRGERRGGYVKVRHLKARQPKVLHCEQPMDAAEHVALAAALQRGGQQQTWAVMDPVHDGAWLRKEPTVDRSTANILCLVPNGAIVIGEFIRVHHVTSGVQGFIRFRDLDQQGPKSWRVKNYLDEAQTPLFAHACILEDQAFDHVQQLSNGDRVDGEFILVNYKHGKRDSKGFIKRQYLTALSRPNLQEHLPKALK